jgi:hypothetical protein
VNDTSLKSLVGRFMVRVNDTSVEGLVDRFEAVALVPIPDLRGIG